MSTILHLKNVAKTFRDEHRKEARILTDINLEIKEGEIFSFLGASGSGKSTLLRLMSGLDKEFTGEIVWAPSANPKECGFVFQQFALLPWLTVHQNIELWLISRNIPLAERERRVKKELQVMKLERAGHLYPHELSGGMKQRVGIARALVIEPKIIFMDEAFSELDSYTAQTLRQELLNIWQERKMTIVMVTHILEEALELADRIAVLTSDHPSTISHVMENSLSRPRQKRSPEFFAHEDKLFGYVRPHLEAKERRDALM
ncbi:MAG: ABC transporter ATP-binding protein [Candidatus Pacebacteria bacterium]|nr:ABC transporter ATP-binding protein [Candidatus Paceibacterota bacterium]